MWNLLQLLERSFDGGTFPRQIGLRAVQSVQSAAMERQRRRWRRNLESLITDPPSKYLIALHSGTSLHLIGFPLQCVVAAVASSVNWRQSREGGGEALGQQLRLHQHSATALCSPLLCMVQYFPIFCSAITLQQRGEQEEESKISSTLKHRKGQSEFSTNGSTFHWKHDA